MNRIDRCFAELAGRKALIPFITAGDPNPGLTVALMDALVAGGADILELGVPFSDPMADGPVIQRASERALVHGVGLRDVLALVAEFRQHNTTTPVVLMGYLNPVEAMGYGEFAQAARAAGVDGLLTVDCPPEEAEALSLALHAEQLAPIYLIAPTTPAARLADIARHARGYVYYVSLKGVTGAANLDVSEVARRVAAIREHIQLPIGVGFGIRDGQTARQVADVSDAVVIGSRLVQAVENAPLDQAAATLQALLADIRAALDA
ncbi:tryptophan synthase subunit alpha [Aquaspirillum sp. LM1]|jgi:tryptophan synthase alpha chain|uniref:tryptophan synthase subunit alpha n=1 Tax=Aquaspirillum sp. LM1 TaxID=1938604 RepID=UPI000983FA02|nr:tryptophan synthase subunit alpha [Aquaspirillum sp. LM1]AQR64585.1 tryptophan synthase subunit alpha [Aquaspirillum sp. LM1]